MEEGGGGGFKMHIQLPILFFGSLWSLLNLAGLVPPVPLNLKILRGFLFCLVFAEVGSLPFVVNDFYSKTSERKVLVYLRPFTM